MLEFEVKIQRTVNEIADVFTWAEDAASANRAVERLMTNNHPSINWCVVTIQEQNVLRTTAMPLTADVKK